MSGNRDQSDNKLYKDSIPSSQDLTNWLDEIFYAFDLDKSIIGYNNRLVEVSGYTKTELTSMAPHDFFPEGQHDFIDETISEVIEAEKSISIEADLLTKSGEMIPYSLSGAPFYDNEGDLAGFVGIGRDITEFKQRTDQLERTVGFLSQVQDVADIGCWEVNFGSDTLRWTDKTFDIHELSHSDPPSIEEAIKYYHPDDREKIQTAFERLKTDGIPFDLKLRIVTAEDKLKWVRARGIPWRTDGELVGARGTFQDITDQYHDKQQVVNQRDDLEILNQMLSHDIRNNLQVVNYRAEYLLDVLADEVSDDVLESVEDILTQSMEAVDLIESARGLATTMVENERESYPVPIRNIVTAQVEHVQDSASTASITIEGQIPDTEVMADDMLPSVFRNILKNAIQHNDKETPEVVVTATQQPSCIKISIADNGPGIPSHQRESIFNKDEKGLQSDGTGIGLYLVETLVELYDGDIWIEDNDPEGAIFNIELPTAG